MQSSRRTLIGHLFIRNIRIVIPGLLLLSLLTAVMKAQAAVRRVPADYPTIQQAIGASSNNDTVVVSAGTYIENINFLGKAITVTSESGPALTIIDGNRNGAVVTFNSGESVNSILHGFTLRNGLIRPDNGFLGAGGGINITGSSPTITGNIITTNQSFGYGGGIAVSKMDFAPVTPSPVITDNMIKSNDSCQGGGIAVLTGSPLIQRNTIDGNTTRICSGGQGGGGILIQSISGAGEINAKILDNLITNNIAQFSGGAGGISIGFTGGGTQLVMGNKISKNNGGQGGGVQAIHKSIVAQNLIIGNQSFQGGGVMVDSGSGSVFVNNTIADNTALQGAGILAFGVTLHKFVNNLIIASTGEAFYGSGQVPGAPIIFDHNNVFSAQGPAYSGTFPDQTGMNGNISAAPLFVNGSPRDYHLRHDSPSIDTGNNGAPNLPAVDLDGNPRIQDGNFDGICVVDMGAYEFSAIFDICIQDDSNGTILRINSMTGSYQFVNCSGISLNGSGLIIRRGGILTLQDYSGGRRVIATFDGGVNRAAASIQSQGMIYTILDRNTANNTCACAAH